MNGKASYALGVIVLMPASVFIIAVLVICC